MHLKFWGVRGSIASPISNETLEAKLKAILRRAISQGVKSDEDIRSFWDSLALAEKGTYGGNTSCITVLDEDRLIVLDAGSGLRIFGKDIVARKTVIDRPIDILLSHYHWDHIGGFPFFAPAFQEGVTIVIHCPTSDGERHFKVQQSSPFSPLEFAFLNANIEFQISSGINQKDINGFRVSAIRTEHPGGSTAYKVQNQNGGLVYMTDTELANVGLEKIEEYSRFFSGATVAVVDAMYGLLETYTSKLRWGHSSAFPFIDICRNTTVKLLVLFHHDPDLDDKDVEEMLYRAKRYYEHNCPGGKMRIIAAYDGLELDVPSMDGTT